LELFNYDNTKYLEQDYFFTFTQLFGYVDRMPTKKNKFLTQSGCKKSYLSWNNLHKPNLGHSWESNNQSILR
jgi:hypothetical protein